MFVAKWADRATNEYESLRQQAQRIYTSRQEGLFKQVHKAIELLLADPRHPSLKTHGYDSLTSPFDPDAKVFEAYAQNDTPGAYRIFWCYGPDKQQITVIAITPHP